MNIEYNFPVRSMGKSKTYNLLKENTIDTVQVSTLTLTLKFQYSTPKIVDGDWMSINNTKVYFKTSPKWNELPTDASAGSSDILYEATKNWIYNLDSLANCKIVRDNFGVLIITSYGAPITFETNTANDVKFIWSITTNTFIDGYSIIGNVFEYETIKYFNQDTFPKKIASLQVKSNDNYFLFDYTNLFETKKYPIPYPKNDDRFYSLFLPHSQYQIEYSYTKNIGNGNYVISSPIQSSLNVWNHYLDHEYAFYNHCLEAIQNGNYYATDTLIKYFYITIIKPFKFAPVQFVIDGVNILVEEEYSNQDADEIIIQFNTFGLDTNYEWEIIQKTPTVSIIKMWRPDLDFPGTITKISNTYTTIDDREYRFTNDWDDQEANQPRKQFLTLRPTTDILLKPNSAVCIYTAGWFNTNMQSEFETISYYNSFFKYKYFDKYNVYRSTFTVDTGISDATGFITHDTRRVDNLADYVKFVEVTAEYSATIDDHNIDTLDHFKPIRYNLVDVCEWDEVYNIVFLNQLGGWDLYQFNEKDKEVEISPTVYTRTLDITQNPYEQFVNDIDVNSTKRITLRRNVENAEVYNWLEELIKSEQIYLIDFDIYDNNNKLTKLSINAHNWSPVFNQTDLTLQITFNIYELV